MFLTSRASSITCWPSATFNPGFLQFEHHRRLDQVDADRHVADAGLAQERSDLLGVPLHQAEGRRHGAAHADQAGLAILRLEPRRIKLVMHGRGAEVPQDRIVAGAGQQREAAELVALPFADLGRGDVADVVDVEDQQRAELGLLQRRLDAAEPIAVQPPIIDALLEIDAHGAECRQRPAPIVARVDVLGADDRRLAGDLVHGVLPGFFVSTITHFPAQRSTQANRSAFPGSAMQRCRPRIVTNSERLRSRVCNDPGSRRRTASRCTVSGERNSCWPTRSPSTPRSSAPTAAPRRCRRPRGSI